MSTVSTHVLDTALGWPAAGVAVRLEQAAAAAGAAGRGGHERGRRIPRRGPGDLPSGSYRVVFDTGAYFTRAGQRAFYPEVAISFLIDAADGHYHVPLVLSPYAYATYRGS